MVHRILEENDQYSAIAFEDDGCIPNSTLPLLIYPQAVSTDLVKAELIEALFLSNNWSPQWRSTVFTYHHYHSTSHEVLGVAQGSASIMFGGEHGLEIALAPGDVALIPAGVGHKRIRSSGDFLVCGAYPPGFEWDLLTGEKGERPQTDLNIAAVPLPKSDPVLGANGPVRAVWRAVSA